MFAQFEWEPDIAAHLNNVKHQTIVQSLELFQVIVENVHHNV